MRHSPLSSLAIPALDMPVIACDPPAMVVTTWRDYVLGQPSSDAETILDDPDPDLDIPFEVATDIDHVVYYIMSVLNATMWTLRSGHDVVIHRHDDGSRHTLSARDSLDTLRVWLHQHAPAYHYDRPDVANDMLALATTLWDVLLEDGTLLFTNVRDLVHHLYM